VPKCIACDVVMMKNILLIYIISTASVMFQSSSSIPFARLSCVLNITLESVFQVDFRFRDPKFGPRVSSAVKMFVFVIRQFCSRSLST